MNEILTQKPSGASHHFRYKNVCVWLPANGKTNRKLKKKLKVFLSNFLNKTCKGQKCLKQKLFAPLKALQRTFKMLKKPNFSAGPKPTKIIIHESIDYLIISLSTKNVSRMGITTALNAENNFQIFLTNRIKIEKRGNTSWSSITCPKPEYALSYIMAIWFVRNSYDQLASLNSFWNNFFERDNSPRTNNSRQVFRIMDESFKVLIN